MFKVTGKGITVKDPEMRYSPNGKAVTRCTLVNNEEYDGQKKGHFTDVVLFGEVAEEFMEEVTKGCLVDIEGILKHPVREKDGKRYYNTEVVVYDFEMVQKFEKKEESSRSSRRSRQGKK